MSTREPVGTPPPHRAGWLAKWEKTNSELQRLKAKHPMLDAVIDQVDGRRIRIGRQWLVDYASCNYLGFDLDPEIMAAVPAYLAEWGTHPSWSRLLGSPVLYEQIEDQLTRLLGAEDVLALPTITHIHMSLIPVLAGEGTIYLDGRAHKTIYDGCSVAHSHGAVVRRFRHNDPEDLLRQLRQPSPPPRLICIDGINSMTGNAPDLPTFARLAREHDALLYVDDAHGFGVVGDRRPDELCDYGVGGNGVVRWTGESYDSVILVAGLSKAYSSLLAFLACPTRVKDALKVYASPYLYSGPSPIASLATVLSGLHVNAERGDLIRKRLHRNTHRVLASLRELMIRTPNHSGFPLIEIPLAQADDVDEVGRYLFGRGIYVTVASYPLVPRSEVGFRIQVTAANSDEEITHLTDVLAEISERFQLQGPSKEAEEPAFDETWPIAAPLPANVEAEQ
jgi:8-amino-7-oxononanoate synthase